MAKGPVDFLLRYFGIRAAQHGSRLALGGLEDLAIADEIGNLETWHPRLTRAKKLSRATELKIEFRDLKAVIGAGHCVQSALSFLRYLATGHQNAIRLCGASPDASP